jgi:hypothetical protein
MDRKGYRTAIPADLRTSFKLNDAQLQKEILQLTDWYDEPSAIHRRRYRGKVKPFPEIQRAIGRLLRHVILHSTSVVKGEKR